MYTKTIIIGRLAKDPEKKTSDTGHTYCHAGIISNGSYAGKQTSSYFPITAYGDLAAAMPEKYKKGDLVLAECRTISKKCDTYTHMIIELILEKIQLLARPRKDCMEYVIREEIGKQMEDILPDKFGSEIGHHYE